MKKIRLFFAGLFLVLAFTAVFQQVNQPTASAQSARNTCDNNKTFLGIPAWYKYLELTPTPGGGCAVNFDNAEGFTRRILPIIFAVIEMLLRVATLVSIGFIVAGGVKYISTQGQPEKEAEARKTAINAVIGLVIALASGAIVQFIAGKF